MRPESRRRRPRSAPRRGDSSRFEFATARPVPSPPAGSQRHVTTGAAEGQSRARAGGRGRRAGRAERPGWRRGVPARPQRPLAGRARGGRQGPESVALATRAWLFPDGPGSSFLTFCPYGGRASLATAWPDWSLCWTRPRWLPKGTNSPEPYERALPSRPRPPRSGHLDLGPRCEISVLQGLSHGRPGKARLARARLL